MATGGRAAEMLLFGPQIVQDFVFGGCVFAVVRVSLRPRFRRIEVAQGGVGDQFGPQPEEVKEAEKDNRHNGKEDHGIGLRFP